MHVMWPTDCIKVCIKWAKIVVGAAAEQHSEAIHKKFGQLNECCNKNDISLVMNLPTSIFRQRLFFLLVCFNRWSISACKSIVINSMT